MLPAGIGLGFAFRSEIERIWPANAATVSSAARIFWFRGTNFIREPAARAAHSSRNIVNYRSQVAKKSPKVTLTRAMRLNVEFLYVSEQSLTAVFLKHLSARIFFNKKKGAERQYLAVNTYDEREGGYRGALMQETSIDDFLCGSHVLGLSLIGAAYFSTFIWDFRCLKSSRDLFPSQNPQNMSEHFLSACEPIRYRQNEEGGEYVNMLPAKTSLLSPVVNKWVMSGFGKINCRGSWQMSTNRVRTMATITEQWRSRGLVCRLREGVHAFVIRANSWVNEFFFESRMLRSFSGLSDSGSRLQISNGKKHRN